MRCKSKLTKQLLLQSYLMWKLLLILILNHFTCYTQNSNRVYTPTLLLMILRIVNQNIHQIKHQPLLLNLEFFLILWEKDGNKRHLPQVQDQHRVRSQRYCVNTHNIFLLLLKLSFSILLIFQFHWNLVPVLTVPFLLTHTQDLPISLETKNQSILSELLILLIFHIIRQKKL